MGVEPILLKPDDFTSVVATVRLDQFMVQLIDRLEAAFRRNDGSVKQIPSARNGRLRLRVSIWLNLVRL